VRFDLEKLLQKQATTALLNDNPNSVWSADRKDNPNSEIIFILFMNVSIFL